MCELASHTIGREAECSVWATVLAQCQGRRLRCAETQPGIARTRGDAQESLRGVRGKTPRGCLGSGKHCDETRENEPRASLRKTPLAKQGV